MKKFEYYEIFPRTGEDITELLDHYGEDGWEAFSILPHGNGIVIYLKREKPCPQTYLRQNPIR